MEQIQRFNLAVSTITVAIMFFIIEFLLPMFQASSLPAAIPGWVPFLAPETIVTVLKFGITGVASVGTYQLVAKGLMGVLDQVPFLKAYIFGSSYIEGTWVGRFSDPQSGPKWTVEHFEQSLGGVVIKGWASNADGSKYADWESDTVSIDARKGILRYTYECDVFLKNTRQQGIGVFKVSQRGWFKTPKAMSGYSADLIDGMRSENNESKVSSSLMPIEDALKLAHAKYT